MKRCPKPPVSASDAHKAINAIGSRVTGEPSLVWGWSKATNSPYNPVWSVPTTEGTRFITSTGEVLEDLGLEAAAR
jgi:hypothetical protein